MDKILQQTTKDDDYPIIFGGFHALTIPGGAGFIPSKVS